MLKATPKGWSSHSFDVHDRAGAHVGAVDLSNWREKAELDVGGASYTTTHKSASPDLLLSGADGATVMVAEQLPHLRVAVALRRGQAC